MSSQLAGETAGGRSRLGLDKVQPILSYYYGICLEIVTILISVVGLGCLPSCLGRQLGGRSRLGLDKVQPILSSYYGICLEIVTNLISVLGLRSIEV